MLKKIEKGMLTNIHRPVAHDLRETLGVNLSVWRKKRENSGKTMFQIYSVI